MKPRRDARLTETRQGAFVLDSRTGKCFALNPVGLHVWKGLEDGRSAEQIVDLLQQRYATVPRSQLTGDVSRFIEWLSSRQLLTSG